MTEPAVVLFIEAGMFCIAGEDDYDVDTADYSNSLLAPMDHGAWVLTGIHVGNVRVETRIASGPAPLETGWEEVVEASVHTSSDLGLSYFHGYGPDSPPLLSNQGPGWYRVRVHARGRELAYDGTAVEPLEDYLLTAWPQDPAPPAVLQSSARIARRLAAAPGPAAAPTPAGAVPTAPPALTPARANLLRHLNRNSGS